MRLLVIDTALGACTAAVFEDERPLAVRFEPMAKGHQERLGGLVRDVMAEAGGGFDALDRIGVTVGPGSFTGLRVGLAFAQGLGAALDLPVVGVSALDGLAASVDSAGPPVAALIDARRGQVYAKLFIDGAAVGPDEALSLDEAARRLADWRFAPNGSEGFAKAEVTVGGISTADLSSQTLEARRVPGLHAIGEAVDVTGWLGGYNFQWAWASGWAAAQAL